MIAITLPGWWLSHNRGELSDGWELDTTKLEPCRMTIMCVNVTGLEDFLKRKCP